MQIIGDKKNYEEHSVKEWSTLTESFLILNGVIITLKKISLTKINLPDKVVQLSCGMKHCIAKTSLKKVYTWGENVNGQLGHGNFKKQKQPKILDFINKYKINVMQIGASAYGSIILDANSKIWWFGSNGTLNDQSHPI